MALDLLRLPFFLSPFLFLSCSLAPELFPILTRLALLPVFTALHYVMFSYYPLAQSSNPLVIIKNEFPQSVLSDSLKNFKGYDPKNPNQFACGTREYTEGIPQKFESAHHPKGQLNVISPSLIPTYYFGRARVPNNTCRTCTFPFPGQILEGTAPTNQDLEVEIQCL